MAATAKCRRVCSGPRALRFSPEGKARGTAVLSVEELESLRLCDFEGLAQDAAAQRMRVSRGTLQRMLYSAHSKTAEALTSGFAIEIGGGSYELSEEWCGCARCKKCPFSDEADRAAKERKKEIMKNGVIAVTEENGEIFQHFGHTQYFALYTISEGKAVDKKIIDAEGSGHSALGGFLREKGADLLICGGIGAGAKKVLADAGIALVSGAKGSTDEAVEAFLAGTLTDSPAGECDHHNHGEEPHGACHGCGHGEGHHSG